MRWDQLKPGDVIVPPQQDHPPWMLLRRDGHWYVWLNLESGELDQDLPDPLYVNVDSHAVVLRGGENVNT